MVVDSSALIAILEREPETLIFRKRLLEAELVLIGSATLFEASLVALSRRGDGGLKQLQDMVIGYGIGVVPLDASHAALALEAFRRFGKGRHRAGLNYGDCMAYALAVATDMPLLFKGDDFIHTDVRSAV